MNWVWVGNFDPDSTWIGEDGQLYSPAQALVIPQILDERPLVSVPIKVCRHPEYSFNHSQANWTFDPADAGAWWTCARFGCCNGG